MNDRSYEVSDGVGITLLTTGFQSPFNMNELRLADVLAHRWDAFVDASIAGRRTPCELVHPTTPNTSCSEEITRGALTELRRLRVRQQHDEKVVMSSFVHPIDLCYRHTGWLVMEEEPSKSTLRQHIASFQQRQRAPLMNFIWQVLCKLRKVVEGLSRIGSHALHCMTEAIPVKMSAQQRNEFSSGSVSNDSVTQAARHSCGGLGGWLPLERIACDDNGEGVVIRFVASIAMQLIPAEVVDIGCHQPRWFRVFRGQLDPETCSEDFSHFGFPAPQIWEALSLYYRVSQSCAALSVVAAAEEDVLRWQRHPASDVWAVGIVGLELMLGATSPKGMPPQGRSFADSSVWYRWLRGLIKELRLSLDKGVENANNADESGEQPLLSTEVDAVASEARAVLAVFPETLIRSVLTMLTWDAQARWDSFTKLCGLQRDSVDAGEAIIERKWMRHVQSELNPLLTCYLTGENIYVPAKGLLIWDLVRQIRAMQRQVALIDANYMPVRDVANAAQFTLWLRVLWTVSPANPLLRRVLRLGSLHERFEVLSNAAPSDWRRKAKLSTTWVAASAVLKVITAAMAGKVAHWISLRCDRRKGRLPPPASLKPSSTACEISTFQRLHELLSSAPSESLSTRAERVRSHLRGGCMTISTSLRADIWAILLEIPLNCSFSAAPPSYLFDSSDADSVAYAASSSDRQVAVDIPRCHQYHPLLSTLDGHRALSRLLRAWLSLQRRRGHPTVYWQGVDTIAAVALCTAYGREWLALRLLDALLQSYAPHPTPQPSQGTDWAEEAGRRAESTGRQTRKDKGGEELAEASWPKEDGTAKRCNVGESRKGGRDLESRMRRADLEWKVKRQDMDEVTSGQREASHSANPEDHRYGHDGNRGSEEKYQCVAEKKLEAMENAAIGGNSRGKVPPDVHWEVQRESGESNVETQLLLLSQLMRLVCPDLVKHLDDVAYSIDWIARGWLLTLFGHVIQIPRVFVVLDAILVEGSGMLRCVAVEVVEFLRPRLMEASDFEGCAEVLKGVAALPWEAVVEKAVALHRRLPPSLRFPPLQRSWGWVVRASAVAMISAQDVAQGWAERPPWTHDGVVLLDVRTAAERQKQNLWIIGARHVPYDGDETWNMLDAVASLNDRSSYWVGVLVGNAERRGTPMVLILCGGNPEAAQATALALARGGIHGVCVLMGGIRELNLRAPQLVVVPPPRFVDVDATVHGASAE